LLDQMAREGRGEVEYVGLEDDGSAAARRFHERVRTPLLTDLKLEWSGVTVSEVYPARLPDLFSAKPVVISGRYDSPGQGILRLRGKQAGRDFVREVPVTLPANQPAHDVLATLWARRKIDALMAKNWSGMQSGNPGPELKEAITKLGVDFGLMTQFTSFVAVEETIHTEGGVPRRVDVPVEMPSGVRYEGIFGDERKDQVAQLMAARPLESSGGFFRRNPAAPRQASAARTEELDRLTKRDGGLLPSEAERAVDLSANNRKIDSALLSGVSTPGISGPVQVKIWLIDTSPEALAMLKKAGFTAKSPVSGRFITGEIDVARLADLARLSCVRYISRP